MGTLFRFRGADPEYALTVAPGADAEAIEVAVEGADSLRVDGCGDLLAEVPGGAFRQSRPRAFEVGPNGSREVTARFALRGGNRYGFALGPHDPGRTLRIDPVLTYASTVGGSRSDQAKRAAFGPDGALWLIGNSSSPDFPTASGAPVGPWPEYFDAIVVRFDPVGRRVLSATWLGGSSVDSASCIGFDTGGNAFVAGTTSSSDFPSAGTPQSSYGGNGDGFVAKLDPGGASLAWATYMGGKSPDKIADLAVSADGDAVVAGDTLSADFPLKNAIETQFSGYYNPIVARLKGDGSGLAFSTFLRAGVQGGTTSVALASDGGIFVCGSLASADFPGAITLAGAHDPLGGDAFLAELEADGQVLRRAVVLRGSSFDDILVEPSGTILALGRTSSLIFGLPAASHGLPGSARDVFLLRLDSALQGMVAGSLFGGSGTENFLSLARASGGMVWVAGSTLSTDLPLAGATQPFPGGQEDAFLAAFDLGGVGLKFSTYVGGSWRDFAGSVALAPDGAAWLVGTTNLSANGDGLPTDMFLARFGMTQGPPPAAPEGLAATQFAWNSVRLNWTDVSAGQAQFAAFRTEGGRSILLGTVEAGTTALVDSGVLPDRNYSYAVQAVNDGGSSPPSSVAEVRTWGSLDTVVDEGCARVVPDWATARRLRVRLRGTLVPNAHSADGKVSPRAEGIAWWMRSRDGFDLPILVSGGKALWQRDGHLLRWRARPLGRYRLAMDYDLRTGRFQLRWDLPISMFPEGIPNEFRIVSGDDGGTLKITWQFDGGSRYTTP